MSNNPLPDVIHVDDVERLFGHLKQNQSFDDILNSVPKNEDSGAEAVLEGDPEDHRVINALMKETFAKIDEYQKLIETAETHTKKDLYRRKIDNLMTKLQHTAANKAAVAKAKAEKQNKVTSNK